MSRFLKRRNGLVIRYRFEKGYFVFTAAVRSASCFLHSAEITICPAGLAEVPPRYPAHAVMAVDGGTRSTCSVYQDQYDGPEFFHRSPAKLYPFYSGNHDTGHR